MNTTCPRVKSTLKVQVETVEGIDFYTVKESEGGKFIRLREPEYFLLNSLDGSRSAADAAEYFVKTYRKQITTDAVSDYIQRLAELGFLEGTSPKLSGKSGSILSVKLKAFNPERLLDWLYPKTLWFFSLPSFIVTCSVILFGGIIFFSNTDAFAYDLGRLFSAANLVAVILAIFLLITIHEFAHALACRRYGGTVREMGFLLLYFQPCFYCNISDAYLLKNKRERIIVTAAGIIFQLFAWGLSTVLWRLTLEGPLLNQLFYVVAAVSFATLAFNLNPGIKLDGYYLLADYLQIPNLRQKAFAYIWEKTKVNLFGCAVRLPTTPSNRERRIYWWYGAFAIAYSLFLIGFLLYRGGELLLGAWGGVGFVLFLFLSLVIFKGLFVKFARESATVWEERRHVWMRPKRIAIYSLIGAAVLLLLTVVPVGQNAGGSARLSAIQTYVIERVGPNQIESRYHRQGADEQQTSQLFQLSSADFSVTDVQKRASPGDTLQKGDTLLVISSLFIEGQLAEASSDLKKSEAERRLLLSDPKVEEISKKKADLKQAEALYEAARKEFNRIKELHTKQLISDDQWEKSASDFNVANSAWEAKKSELKLLRSGPKIEEVEQVDAEIEKLKARCAYLQNQIASSVILSPFTGVLLGTEEQELYRLADLESLVVDIRLEETDLDIVNSGSELKLRVSAYPTVTQVGRVFQLKLSPEPHAMGMIPNNEGHLIPDMTGYAKVDCGSISLASLIVRKVSRFLRLEFWSWF